MEKFVEKMKESKDLPAKGAILAKIEKILSCFYKLSYNINDFRCRHIICRV